jgi:hypothetical protein
MSKLLALYVKNHRQQMLMLASGVGAPILLGLTQSNERAMFASNSAAAPAAFAAIANSGEPETVFRQQRKRPAEAFIARLRQPGASGPPASTAPTAPGNRLLALVQPDEFGSIPDLFLDPLDNPASTNNLANALPGAPQAGSSPVGFALAPTVPVPAVPEPETWAMMIVGFFLVGSSLRMRRRNQSVELKPVAGKAD